MATLAKTTSLAHAFRRAATQTPWTVSLLVPEDALSFEAQQVSVNLAGLAFGIGAYFFGK